MVRTRGLGHGLKPAGFIRDPGSSPPLLRHSSPLGLMVRTRGLEPPQPFGYTHLKRTRIPIPPRPQTPMVGWRGLGHAFSSADEPLDPASPSTSLRGREPSGRIGSGSGIQILSNLWWAGEDLNLHGLTAIRF